MIGQKLNNRYIITGRLGEGGMGEVFQATDEQNGQQVAIKVLARQLTTQPESLERFRREAETLQQLDHPNIVKFIDAFEYEQQYVIVMEYVPGGSLHELIKAGPLSVERAGQIALDLCDALIRAHRLNIIHRDLKPENVLINKVGTPKLADFGVAKLSEGTRMTRSGTQIGTPYYMAPEAWEGKTLDAQADVWSLGILFFEMLTGQVPFNGDTGAAVMNKVLTTQPPDLRKLGVEVSPNLIRIIKRMLNRDKKQRYQSMREVAVDLERDQSDPGKTNGQVVTKNKFRLWAVVAGITIIVSIGLVIFKARNSIKLPISDPEAPTSSAQTINSSITSAATVAEEKETYYDKFEEQLHDGDFDHSLWIAKSSNCRITQLDGALQFTNDPAGSQHECDLYAGKPATLQSPSQLGVFETQAMISSDFNHRSLVTQELQFRTDSLSEGSWFAICGLIAEGSNKVEGFINISLYGQSSTDYQDYYETTPVEQEFDTWHTIHMEMNPKSLAISCLIDGQLVGSVIPRDADLLAHAQFAQIIKAARGLEAVATSYIDNVYFEPPPTLAWEFNTNGDSEGWGAKDWQYVDLTAPKVSNGILSLVATGNDPQIYIQEGVSINAATAKTMQIRMRISKGSNPAALFFNNVLDSNNWVERRAKKFSVQTGSEFNTYTVDLGSEHNWHGIINELRLDPISDSVGSIIEIDYIRFYP